MSAKPKKRPKTRRGVSCPDCAAATSCVYSRPHGAITFRRRECSNPKCGLRFTTSEKIVNRSVAADAESSTRRTQIGMSITDLVRTLGLTAADLQLPVTLAKGDDHGRDASRQN
jgi:hypothetical protein